MKYIFLAKPHPQWEYCGGGCAIIASSFEEAQALLHAHDEHLLVDTNTLQKKFVYNTWILVRKIEVSEQEETKIVMHDYNYS